MTKGEVEGLPESAKGTTHNLHPNPEAAENSGGAPPTPEEKAAADNKAMLGELDDQMHPSAYRKKSHRETTTKHKPAYSGRAPVHGANTMLQREDSKNQKGIYNFQ